MGYLDWVEQKLKDQIEDPQSRQERLAGATVRAGLGLPDFLKNRLQEDAKPLAQNLFKVTPVVGSLPDVFQGHPEAVVTDPFEGAMGLFDLTSKYGARPILGQYTKHRSHLMNQMPDVPGNFVAGPMGVVQQQLAAQTAGLQTRVQDGQVQVLVPGELVYRAPWEEVLKDNIVDQALHGRSPGSKEYKKTWISLDRYQQLKQELKQAQQAPSYTQAYREVQGGTGNQMIDESLTDPTLILGGSLGELAKTLRVAAYGADAAEGLSLAGRAAEAGKVEELANPMAVREAQSTARSFMQRGLDGANQFKQSLAEMLVHPVEGLNLANETWNRAQSVPFEGGVKGVTWLIKKTPLARIPERVALSVAGKKLNRIIEKLQQYGGDHLTLYRAVGQNDEPLHEGAITVSNEAGQPLDPNAIQQVFIDPVTQISDQAQILSQDQYHVTLRLENTESQRLDTDLLLQGLGASAQPLPGSGPQTQWWQNLYPDRPSERDFVAPLDTRSDPNLGKTASPVSEIGFRQRLAVPPAFNKLDPEAQLPEAYAQNAALTKSIADSFDQLFLRARGQFPSVGSGIAETTLFPDFPGQVGVQPLFRTNELEVWRMGYGDRQFNVYVTPIEINQNVYGSNLLIREVGAKGDLVQLNKDYPPVNSLYLYRGLYNSPENALHGAAADFFDEVVELRLAGLNQARDLSHTIQQGIQQAGLDPKTYSDEALKVAAQVTHLSPESPYLQRLTQIAVSSNPEELTQPVPVLAHEQHLGNRYLRSQLKNKGLDKLGLSTQNDLRSRILPQSPEERQALANELESRAQAFTNKTAFAGDEFNRVDLGSQEGQLDPYLQGLEDNAGILDQILGQPQSPDQITQLFSGTTYSDMAQQNDNAATRKYLPKGHRMTETAQQLTHAVQRLYRDQDPQELTHLLENLGYQTIPLGNLRAGIEIPLSQGSIILDSSFGNRWESNLDKVLRLVIKGYDDIMAADKSSELYGLQQKLVQGIKDITSQTQREVIGGERIPEWLQESRGPIDQATQLAKEVASRKDNRALTEADAAFSISEYGQSNGANWVHEVLTSTNKNYSYQVIRDEKGRPVGIVATVINPKSQQVRPATDWFAEMARTSWNNTAESGIIIAPDGSTITVPDLTDLNAMENFQALLSRRGKDLSPDEAIKVMRKHKRGINRNIGMFKDFYGRLPQGQTLEDYLVNQERQGGIQLIADGEPLPQAPDKVLGSDISNAQTEDQALNADSGFEGAKLDFNVKTERIPWEQLPDTWTFRTARNLPGNTPQVSVLRTRLAEAQSGLRLPEVIAHAVSGDVGPLLDFLSFTGARLEPSPQGLEVINGRLRILIPTDRINSHDIFSLAHVLNPDLRPEELRLVRDQVAQALKNLTPLQAQPTSGMRDLLAGRLKQAMDRLSAGNLPENPDLIDLSAAARLAQQGDQGPLQHLLRPFGYEIQGDQIIHLRDSSVSHEYLAKLGQREGLIPNPYHTAMDEWAGLVNGPKDLRITRDAVSRLLAMQELKPQDLTSLGYSRDQIHRVVDQLVEHNLAFVPDETRPLEITSKSTGALQRVNELLYGVEDQVRTTNERNAKKLNQGHALIEKVGDTIRGFETRRDARISSLSERIQKAQAQIERLNQEIEDHTQLDRPGSPKAIRDAQAQIEQRMSELQAMDTERINLTQVAGSQKLYQAIVDLYTGENPELVLNQLKQLQQATMTVAKNRARIAPLLHDADIQQIMRAVADNAPQISHSFEVSPRGVMQALFGHEPGNSQLIHHLSTVEPKDLIPADLRQAENQLARVEEQIPQDRLTLAKQTVQKNWNDLSWSGKLEVPTGAQAPDLPQMPQEIQTLQQALQAKIDLVAKGADRSGVGQVIAGEEHLGQLGLGEAQFSAYDSQYQRLIDAQDKLNQALENLFGSPEPLTSHLQIRTDLAEALIDGGKGQFDTMANWLTETFGIPQSQIIPVQDGLKVVTPEGTRELNRARVDSLLTQVESLVTSLGYDPRMTDRAGLLRRATAQAVGIPSMVESTGRDIMSTGPRVLISGSRDGVDPALVKQVIDALPEGTTIIHGAARGVDRTADQAAKARGLKVEPYPADWENLGRGAGHARNGQMLKEGKPDLVIALHPESGITAGTGNMVRQSEQAGVKTITITKPEDIAKISIPQSSLSVNPEIKLQAQKISKAMLAPFQKEMPHSFRELAVAKYLDDLENALSEASATLDLNFHSPSLDESASYHLPVLKVEVHFPGKRTVSVHEIPLDAGDKAHLPVPGEKGRVDVRSQWEAGPGAEVKIEKGLSLATNQGAQAGTSPIILDVNKINDLQEQFLAELISSEPGLIEALQNRGEKIPEEVIQKFQQRVKMIAGRLCG